jgi:TetR/AcrR family transcriptional repressor of nem operon
LQRYIAAVGDIAAVLQDRTLAPKARLQQFFDGMIAGNAANDFHSGCLLGNFSTELSNQIPAMRSTMQQALAGSGEMLAAVIAEGQQDGSIGNRAPAAELAAFINDAWQGSVLHAKTEQNQAPLDRFTRIVLSNILA